MSEELEEYPREPLDTDTIFAKFTRAHLSEFEIMSLSLASMVSNPSVPAADIYLTYVSQCDCYVENIRSFCLGLAHAMANAKKPSKGGYDIPNMHAYSDSWGKYAVADAMVIAFAGKEHAPIVEGPGGREATLKVSSKTYRRVRDFLAGVLTLTIMDYREALEWAMGKRRDTILQSRWGRVTGRKFPPKGVHDIMGRETQESLPSGCFLTEPTEDSDTACRNERLNIGFSDDDLWRP